MTITTTPAKGDSYCWCGTLRRLRLHQPFRLLLRSAAGGPLNSVSVANSKRRSFNASLRCVSGGAAEVLPARPGLQHRAGELWFGRLHSGTIEARQPTSENVNSTSLAPGEYRRQVLQEQSWRRIESPCKSRCRTPAGSTAHVRALGDAGRGERSPVTNAST